MNKKQIKYIEYINRFRYPNDFFGIADTRKERRAMAQMVIDFTTARDFNRIAFLKACGFDK